MKKLLILASILLFSTIMKAQYSFGVFGRANTSTFRTNSSLRTKEITVNPELGLLIQRKLTPSVGLRIESLFTMTGARYGTFDSRPREYDLRLRYVKLPLSIYYTHRAFTFSAGYYEAYMMDKVTIGSFYNRNYSFYSTHWIANRSDRGVVGGLNVYLNPVSWTTQFTYGLRRLGFDDRNPTLYNERNVSISTGLLYSFTLKHKKK